MEVDTAYIIHVCVIDVHLRIQIVYFLSAEIIIAPIDVNSNA